MSVYMYVRIYQQIDIHKSTKTTTNSAGTATGRVSVAFDAAAAGGTSVRQGTECEEAVMAIEMFSWTRGRKTT